MKLKHNTETIEIKSRLPVVPLRDVVVFPHMIYPLLVGRKMTVNALQEAMVRDKQLFLMAQRSPSIEVPATEDLFDVGVVARVLQVMKMPNGTLKVLVEGLVRAEVVRLAKTENHLSARIRVIPPDVEQYDRETEALSRKVTEQFAEYIRLNRRIPDEVLVSVASIEEYTQLADTIAAHILHKIETKQAILSAYSIKEQFRILTDVLTEEIEILRLEQKIDGSVRDSMSRSQREMYLQQQLKAIKDELGQADDQSADVEDLLSQLSSRAYPQRVKEKAEEEIKRLSRMHPYSAESGVVRSYVEWLLALPWEITTEDRTDFNEVQTILDGDHYGLEKAKKRILEHLAVIRLAGKVKGPILCLVGPPGVGKTSVGRSIARAMGRNFVRMSLGGIHDEAEIRGHRRTYIGAMPGRIIQALKKTESSNPVFLLDEIDKVGKDFRGDPASALLEVLDPEQNNTFSDNYLEVEYDLSEILFITTANTTASIPAPLRDRMEIIRLPGYLEFEKASIARDYLFPKVKKEMGVESMDLSLKDDAMYEVIRYYTREAGVRELERKLTEMVRKTAVDLARGRRIRRVVFNKAKVGKLLGPRRYVDTNLKTHPTVGYAVGLAWTEMGGEALPVEVLPMRGKAKLTLTGSLGDVMRESASAALSYIRNHTKRYGLADEFYEEIELHVHIPEGAVPKDGPSAGITLAVAMLSSLTGIPVRTDIAMTGEITLTGDVLPIGGLNEKLLAAKRNGITEIIVPERNRKDLPDLQPELLDGLQLHFVRRIDDVIKLAMTQAPGDRQTRRAQQPAANRPS
ncbi:MAG: endopeptidase La [candidate division Zixibacteria bacterium]|jgi:ATP-dependent Lon protease|nr:endopeptidase La [candidate division Zixibacteria bacterium]